MLATAASARGARHTATAFTRPTLARCPGAFPPSYCQVDRRPLSLAYLRSRQSQYKNCSRARRYRRSMLAQLIDAKQLMIPRRYASLDLQISGPSQATFFAEPSESRPCTKIAKYRTRAAANHPGSISGAGTVDKIMGARPRHEPTHTSSSSVA